jgi:hypothetical protein
MFYYTMIYFKSALFQLTGNPAYHFIPAKEMQPKWLTHWFSFATPVSSPLVHYETPTPVLSAARVVTPLTQSAVPHFIKRRLRFDGWEIFIYNILFILYFNNFAIEYYFNNFATK